jgi:3-phenylpropionate/trans-cinnamate dioxygenase ferredoxin reductase subunit
MRNQKSRERAGDGIVIAGGGLAGQRCIEGLRRGGYDSTIRMVSSELHPPYDRPPLSKAALVDPAMEERLAFRAPRWYDEQSVELLLGVGATRLRPAERILELSDGAQLGYRKLLICTGGRPRTLPLLSGYDNVSVLRTRDDARWLRHALQERGRLAVIGAGFIGLEIAATARRLGVEVTIIEAAACPLENVLGPELGGWLARLHRAEGADVRPATTVDRVQGRSTARRLWLSDGSTLEVDHAVVGVGISPEVGWLTDSGLDASGGVPVDDAGRTAIDDVFAAGDAAATFDAGRGRHVPGSHWEAAGRQGTRAARAMLGLDPGPAPLTSFWTDQYGLRIQYVGQRRAGDALAVEGDLDARNFTATFSRAGRAVAALLVDRPHHLPAARQAIEKGSHDELHR